jgi:hypothetical protein
MALPFFLRFDRLRQRGAQPSRASAASTADAN